MQKLKPLLPTLKERKRYLVFEIVTKSDVPWNLAKKELEKTLFAYLGIKGMADVGLVFLPKLYKKNSGVFRVSHKMVPDVKAGLLFLKSIDGKRVCVTISLVTGILAKAKKKVTDLSS